MKMQYFQGNDGCGFEPICGTAGIANGTAYSMGHLIAASICHGGPGPVFFSSLDIQIHHWWFKRSAERFAQRTIWFVLL